VLQPFLNLFDEGWLTDQRGVKAYADKAIFILTSNVGQRMIAELFQQGKSPDEVAERMRDALPGIRHSKSERPVFTPEFLARIKRIIVFKPLDHDAMAGISRKLVRELQETWAAKRGRSLEVPECLLQHLGEQAHQINEKAKGREGGRIVRKLIAEWLEAPLQRAISELPDAYRACESVLLDVALPLQAPADGTPSAPEVSVRFGVRPSP
jgi:ATP-dependent Clp protease ATP-binding subunit ClpA